MLGAADFWLNGWGANSPTITDSISAISGLSARWRADQITGVANGGAVASWTDASGHEYTATQGTAGQQPTWRAAAIAGQPAVRFDGVGSFFTTTAPAGSAQLTSVVVMSTAGSGIRAFLSSSALGGFEFRVEADDTLRMVKMGVVDIGFSSATVPPGAGTGGLVTYDTTSGAYAFQISGAAAGTGTNAQTLDSTTNIYIGKNPAFGVPFAGDIAEIIMFTRVLTSTELNTVNSYIASRYLSTSGSIALDGAATSSASVAAPGSLTVGGSSTARASTAPVGAVTLGGSATPQAPTSAAGTISLGGVGAAQAGGTASGSLALGGTAATTAPATSSGGATLAGVVTAQAAATAAGSITLGGSATTTAAAAATSAVTLSGTATSRAPATAAGSATLSGTSTATVPVSTSGTVTLGGATTGTAASTAAGTVSLSAVATGTQVGTNAATGSVILGGAATATARVAAAGGITLAGAAQFAALANAAGSVTLAGLATARTTATAIGGVTLGGLATGTAAGALRDITLTIGPLTARTLGTTVASRAASASIERHANAPMYPSWGTFPGAHLFPGRATAIVTSATVEARTITAPATATRTLVGTLEA